MGNLSAQTLITTRFGRYVWLPVLQLVDFIPIGKRKSSHTLHLGSNENTELGALLKASSDMLDKLKDVKRKRTSESAKTV